MGEMTEVERSRPNRSSPAAMTGQLALPFVTDPRFTPDFLETPSNAAALAWLGREPWPGGRLALWGEAGAGKSHLLHLWAARTGAAVVRVEAATSGPPERPVAIDDADAAPERPLLHLLNAAAEAGWPVLLAARRPPARWGTVLPDLVSRLRAITAVEIGQPDEAMLRALLARLVAERQLAVPEAVQEWLLTRLPRTAGAMRDIAERLDGASLAARRPVTRAMAAALLEHDVFVEASPDPPPLR